VEYILYSNVFFLYFVTLYFSPAKLVRSNIVFIIFAIFHVTVCFQFCIPYF
jgi:hypothetical protein